MICNAHPGYIYQAVKEAHPTTGDSTLAVALKRGASEAVKSMVMDAYPEVLEGVTLVEAIEGGWGGSAAKHILAADPEVCIVQVCEIQVAVSFLS